MGRNELIITPNDVDREASSVTSALACRRSLLVGVPLLGVVLGSCGTQPKADYATAILQTWKPFQFAEGEQTSRELVRLATLAPSSHNTQPWKFRIDGNSITILPDFSRRCPEVDPDDHHLFVSLGCAAENLAVAAQVAGFKAVMGSENGFRMALEPTKPVASAMADAIPRRQSSRSKYDGLALASSELKLLEASATGNGVSILLFTDRQKLETVAEYISEGNRVQIGDRVWMQELERWLRFNEADALSTRDGLYSKTTGNPEVPRVIGKALLRLAFSPESQTKTDLKNLRSSAGIAVFTSESNDKQSWFEVGRAYERFALQATVLGIRNAFLNQPVEVAKVRPQFASWLGIGSRRPDLVVRFGRGPEMPRSLRRPLSEVIL